MAVGERCPACGHMPSEERRPDLCGWQLIMHAVDLTKHTLTPGMTAEQIALRLATLHGALMGLTFAQKTDDPPA